ncbi:DUF1028 domain-containing protein [Spiractinospora alimapuensis]|uniref:DUF1028 domain-containing protein n=1 Tax=Spiractinospora alimapuensis TaxID=2820884 RepID=UPI001F31AAF2|nr:DUF1028 domain-containing protein [Spiractinospora alimapuensis]QVQ53279.1 DUF1028 domain-containing protein [Spiractinospora alimapuensis]
MLAGTFSIVAYDVDQSVCGVAVSSAMPAIGALSVFARVGHGAIATQALINPLLGVDGIELLASTPAERALGQLLATDPASDLRQVALVDRHGHGAAHTGDGTHPWSGHRTGEGYAVAGNMLVGERVLTDMAERFEANRGEPLHERLLRALEAGQAAGGDHRGRQSAALRLDTGLPYPYLDLRVDDHHDPVDELRRVHTVARQELLPFIDTLPTRENPAGRWDPW